MTEEGAVAEAVAPSASGGDDNKLHVLYLNHSGQMSGAEQSLRALLWQLRRAHQEIDPVIGLPSTGPFAQMLRDEEWNVTFAPLRRLQRPHDLISGMAALVNIMSTTPFVTRMVQQTRAQLVHSNSTTAHLVGGKAAERCKKPAIWHARDLVSLARIAPNLASHATKVIAISSCVAERLEKDGVPAEKIRVIHNGLDPDEWYPPERSQLRESLGLPDNTFIFGCVGQLVPWKNHSLFIEAAARLAQEEGCAHARFVILGGDLWGEQQNYVQELRALIKKHNLQDRFNFIPHQANNIDAMSALDAVVLASREEPFGRVLIEGMALSKVVIAYGDNGPAEIVRHEKDGLLVPTEEEDGLANAMRRVLQDAAVREELQRAARPAIIERFHIADSAQRVLDLYHEILD